MVYFRIYGKDSQDASSSDVVEELKKQLREKDLVLTDIRLEALSSAHQLESLKDTVIKMRVSVFVLVAVFIFQIMRYCLCVFSNCIAMISIALNKLLKKNSYLLE